MSEDGRGADRFTLVSASPRAPYPPGSSEAEYRKLANALPQIIWTCDAQGRLEWVNDRWIELTGLTEAESLRDKGALVAVHPTIGRAPAALGARARRRRRRASSNTGSATEAASIAGTSRGSCRSGTRAASSRGGWPRRSTFTIAAWRRTRCARPSAGSRRSSTSIRSRRRSRASPTARYLSVNDAFVKLTGFSRDEVIGQSAVTLGIWTAEQRAGLRRAAARRRRRRPPRFRSAPRTGAPLQLVIASARIDFGGEPCLVNVATDVTERRANEAALRQSEAQARARADELAALMDAVPAAVWISQDPECREMRGNRAGHELLRIAGRQQPLEDGRRSDSHPALQGVRERRPSLRTNSCRCSGRRAASRSGTTKRRSGSTTGR